MKWNEFKSLEYEWENSYSLENTHFVTEEKLDKIFETHELLQGIKLIISRFAIMFLYLEIMH